MKFQTRVSLIVVALACFIVLALVLVARQTTHHATQQVAKAIAPAKRVLWEQALASQFEHMAQGLIDLERDFYIRQALKQKDATALAQSGASFVNLVRDQGYFQTLLLANTEGHVLYQSDANYPGLGHEGLIRAALAETATQSGLLRDATGRLVAVMAHPLRIRRKLIGVGVFVASPRLAVEAFQTGSEQEIILANGDGERDWSTQPDLLPNLALPPLGDIALTRPRVGRKAYLVVVLPVRDPEGKPLAHLVSVTDHSEAYFRELLLTVAAHGVIGLIVVLTLIGLYRFIARALRPVEDIVLSLERVARGELLIAPSKLSNQREIRQIQQTTQAMTEELRKLVEQIHVGTHQVASSARQMFAVAEQTNQATHEQTEETRQVSILSERLAKSVREIAQHTEASADAAKVTHQQAAEGGEAMTRTAAEMSILSGKVENAARIIADLAREIQLVGGIIEVVEDIAEHTDRLSLNAALEAARAGDAGRGFAVIAEEVRTLARRTQQSMQEIHATLRGLTNSAQRAVTMMDDSRRQAKVGVELADRTAIKLQDITETAIQIMEMTRQVATALEQQSLSATEINQSMELIAEHSRQTEEQAQQTTQVGESLHALAASLAQVTARFRV